MALTIKTIEDYVDQVSLATGDSKASTRETLRQFGEALQYDLANISPEQRIVLADLGVFSGVQRAARPAISAGKREIKAVPARTAVRWRPHAQIRNAHKVG